MTTVLPYNGTAGWSGSSTSKDRAVYNVKSGKEKNNQTKALELIKQMKSWGLTWKELSLETKSHHGTASGTLSVLHKTGQIVRTNKSRLGCKVYLHPDYITSTVTVEPHGRQNNYCTNCGIIIAQNPSVN